MKNIMIRRIARVILPLLFLAACTIEESDEASEAGLPKISDMDISISVDTANQVTFRPENTDTIVSYISNPAVFCRVIKINT